MINPIDIDALRQLMEKATAGRLFAADGGICVDPMPADGGNVICLEPERVMQASLNRWPDNAAFIVAAVNALPSLLTELEALRASRGRMRELAEDANDNFGRALDKLVEAGRPGWAETQRDYYKAIRAALQPAEDCGEVTHG